ncbi:MAG: S-methyl-5-thioribose-1-phosphate isomerase [Balneolaceae bacterium]
MHSTTDNNSTTDTDNEVRSILWKEDHLRIIDQTFLPSREIYTTLSTAGQVWEAIRELRVRGASAIGIAAAYGLYMGSRDIADNGYESFCLELKRLSEYLATARPNIVNLQWALNRINSTIQAHRDKDTEDLKGIILHTANTIYDEDRRHCRTIGENGLDIVPENARILTHCNTGNLATAGDGTAFSVIAHAHLAGMIRNIWIGETRPLLQGARLTTWELQKKEIPFTLITDSTAGYLMKQGEVDLVIVGADRIAANGDTAGRIGTYSLAVLAAGHNIPFYVAASCSTIDLCHPEGSDIPLEQRSPGEVTQYGNTQTAPKKTDAYNPAFDITPHSYIAGFITEHGIIRPDYTANLPAAIQS